MGNHDNLDNLVRSGGLKMNLPIRGSARGLLNPQEIA